MFEYAPNQMMRLVPLFREMEHHLSIAGVLAGAVPGRAWANSTATCALVMSPQGFLFGGRPDAAFLSDCEKLLREELLPKRVAAGEMDYVVFYPDGWRPVVEEALKSLEPMADGRMTWERSLAGVSARLPEGVRPVTAELLSRGDLKGLDWTLEEIGEGWNTPEEFCRRGFGTVAVVREPDGERIIGWCLTDWVVGDRCELGVAVAEGHRLRGHGLRLALGTLALAAGRGITRAGWQCWSSNLGSQGVARAAGFQPRAEFPVLFGWNHPMNNALINGNYYLNDHPAVGVMRDYRRAADFYARALEKDWDWGGNPILYYNTACLYDRSGEPERARAYMRRALGKGFKGIEEKKDTWEWQYTYHEDDADEIINRLS